jgi:hypothetical protein
MPRKGTAPARLVSQLIKSQSCPSKPKENKRENTVASLHVINLGQLTWLVAWLVGSRASKPTGQSHT